MGARHAIDDARFPRHPTHSLSTGSGPAHPQPHLINVRHSSVAEESTHLAHTWPQQQHRIHTQGGMPAYSVLANVNNSDPTHVHELGGTNSRAEPAERASDAPRGRLITNVTHIGLIPYSVQIWC